MIKTPEEFEEKAEEYFADCLKVGEQPLITGLMLHLGFASRQSFYDYEKRGPFSYVVKRARLRVEMAYEKRLLSTSPTGAIFALKNMGWSDRMDMRHSGEIKGGVLVVPQGEEDEWDQLARREQALHGNGAGEDD